MFKSLALILVIAAAAVVARWAIYGSALSPSPLLGYVVLSAFAGGVALAFRRPFLLVLVPYLAVLFGDLKEGDSASSGRWAVWSPPACYLGAFALAVTVTISGFPGTIATPLHQSEWVVDRAGGVILLVWGLLASLNPLSRDTIYPALVGGPRVLDSGLAGLLGPATGVLLYHELDPTYDSVFFLVGNAGPASHAPLTVAVFAAGLGLSYLAAGTAVTAIASRSRWGQRVLLGGRILSGIATAWIRLAILTGRFGVVRGLLF